MAEKKYDILIVDDDKFLLGMYELKFRNNGHKVTTMTSASDALAKLKEGYTPQIALLDIVLPGMDGLQLLEAIRKEHLLEHSAVIMLTNQGGAEEIDKAKSLNVDGYIVKATFIPSEVVEEVLKIAEARKI